MFPQIRENDICLITNNMTWCNKMQILYSAFSEWYVFHLMTTFKSRLCLKENVWLLIFTEIHGCTIVIILLSSYQDCNINKRTHFLDRLHIKRRSCNIEWTHLLLLVHTYNCFRKAVSRIKHIYFILYPFVITAKVYLIIHLLWILVNVFICLLPSK